LRDREIPDLHEAEMVKRSVSATELRPLLRPWLAALRQRSEHTARNYEVACRRFLDELGEREVDPQAIADYLDSLRGLAPGSRAAHISAVRSFLKLAQDQGVIERSPRELLVRPRVAITSYGRFLNVDEIRAVVAAARELGPLHEAIVLLLAGTGLRVSEAAGAEWRDLFHDPAGRLGLRVVGKSGKERVVKIRGDVFAAIVRLHGSDELDASDRMPLFPSPRGGAYSSWSLWAKFRGAVGKSGITKPASPHWARHSHATLAAAGGSTAFEIMGALGHAKLETSQRYVHMATGLERTTVDALPAFE
jgi:site-specific recombinase XerD